MINDKLPLSNAALLCSVLFEINKKQKANIKYGKVLGQHDKKCTEQIQTILWSGLHLPSNYFQRKMHFSDNDAALKMLTSLNLNAYIGICFTVWCMHATLQVMEELVA